MSEINNRFVRVEVKERSNEKDVIATLALKELLIRLTQTQARKLLQQTYKQLATHYRFRHMVDFIKNNIGEQLTIGTLSSEACMSKSHFSRTFKNDLGLSPMEFILKERLMLAKNHLRTANYQIQEVCYMAGFKKITYFSRAFKAEFVITPKVFQNTH